MKTQEAKYKKNDGWKNGQSKMKSRCLLQNKQNKISYGYTIKKLFLHIIYTLAATPLEAFKVGRGKEDLIKFEFQKSKKYFFFVGEGG